MPAYETAPCSRCDREDAAMFMQDGLCQSCEMERDLLKAEETQVFRGFKVSDLRKAFDKLADPTDWKGPIVARVAGEAVTMAVVAVAYFTATIPAVGYAPHQNEALPFVIESKGYRAGPAGAGEPEEELVRDILRSRSM